MSVVPSSEIRAPSTEHKDPCWCPTSGCDQKSCTFPDYPTCNGGDCDQTGTSGPSCRARGVFKMLHTILAAVEGVLELEGAAKITAFGQPVMQGGVARRAAINPDVMEDDVTKPAQGTPLASVEGAQITVFLLRRVVTSGPNQGVCFIQNENVSVSYFCNVDGDGDADATNVRCSR